MCVSLDVCFLKYNDTDPQSYPLNSNQSYQVVSFIIRPNSIHPHIPLELA